MHWRKTTRVLLLALAGCSLETTTEPANIYQWHAQIGGFEGFEQITGDAGFVWSEGRGRFNAGVAVTGDEPTSVRLWHIHNGTCEEPGSIVGDPGDYPQLVINAEGAALAETIVDRAVRPSDQFHVDLHESPTEFRTIIACSNFQLQGVE